MLLLQKFQYHQMIAHARSCLPNEACGLLAGVEEDGKKTVRRIYLLTNTDQSPEHFSMDPREQFAALRDARNNGWEILGNFHSHPSTPSFPSAEDIRLAFDSSLSYIILSLANEQQPVVKSFRIKSSVVTEEPCHVWEEAAERRFG